MYSFNLFDSVTKKRKPVITACISLESAQRKLKPYFCLRTQNRADQYPALTYLVRRVLVGFREKKNHNCLLPVSQLLSTYIFMLYL